MNKPVVAVRDRQMGAFMNPFIAPTVGVAVRSFADAVNEKDSGMYSHPEDYELFQLAEFDDVSGKFVCLETPKSLAIASNFKEDK